MGWWRFIRAKWRAFWSLPPGDRRLVLLAAALLPLTSVLLRVAGFRRCRAWMMQAAARGPAAPRQTEESGESQPPSPCDRPQRSGDGAAPARPDLGLRLEAPSRARQRAVVTAGLVEKAARFSFCRYSCLPRSLVTWRLVRRQGIAAALRIGVRRAGDRVQAHAWVEVEGRPLVETSDASFTPFEHDWMAGDPCDNTADERAGRVLESPASPGTE